MVLLTDESRIPILRLVDGFFVTQPENFIPFDLAIYFAILPSSETVLFFRAFFKTQVYNEKLHEYAECGSLRSRY